MRKREKGKGEYSKFLDLINAEIKIRGTVNRIKIPGGNCHY
jgi:hypothetical protein